VDADEFVSVRCAVVLAGPQKYAQVLGSPRALSQHVWADFWDAEEVLAVVDSVFEEREIGTGALPDLGRTSTGSNPLGFHDEDPFFADDEGDIPWILISYSLDDSAFIRRWEPDGPWDIFSGAVQAIIDELMADEELRKWFLSREFQKIWLGLTMARRVHGTGVRVRREGSDLEVEVTCVFTLKDPTPEQLEDWARGVLTNALSIAQERIAAQ